NGLVQHRRYRNWNETLKTNLLVDLDSSLSPDDKDFPMVMSREKLVGDVEVEVSEWHSFHSQNAATTDTIVARKITNPQTSFSKGRLFIGKRNPSGIIEDRIRDFDAPQFKAVKDWLGTARYQNINLDEESGILEFYDPDSKMPLLRMFDYHPSPDDIDRDSRFICTWALILEQILLEGIKFGVGIIGDDSTAAEITEVEGIQFFCINPKLFPEQECAEAQVLAIWHEACHEAAHLQESAHNERLTFLIAYLHTATAYGIWKNMKAFAKQLLEW
ncbi:MAG TPA: hypothetical protein VJ044_20505, partial [Candidatus Hodarchaeales archaeon]|nr:hypothetical protein [Candidatus Hodarchaeales archaeon]